MKGFDSTPTAIRMKVFKDLSQSELDQFIQLYSSSFLPVETKPVTKVLSMLNHENNDHGTKRYNLYAAMRDEHMLGFSLLYVFRNLHVGLLDYMAVLPSKQNKGIGKMIFQHTMGAFQREVIEPVGLLLEVQNEKYAQNDRDKEIRRGRLNFYRQLGAKIITDHYLLPPQSGIEPEETYLLLVPCSNKTLDFNTKENILQYTKVIHQQVYQYYSDDLWREMASKLPDKSIVTDIVVNRK